MTVSCNFQTNFSCVFLFHIYFEVCNEVVVELFHVLSMCALDGTSLCWLLCDLIRTLPNMGNIGK